MSLLIGAFASASGDVYEIVRSNNFLDGSLTNNNQTWSSQNSVVRGYGGAIIKKIFEGDFTVVGSWSHNYMGVGMVYKSNPLLTDFVGNSADNGGIYWGSLGVSGFPTNAGYSFLGQYHAPISGSGASSHTKKTYFKWQRSGNTLTIQYSYKSASGPWTNISTNYTASIASGDKVIIGWGEASEDEWDPFRLISVNGESVSLTSSSNDIGQNILTPYAYHGNATAFSWSYGSGYNTSFPSWGRPEYLADATDRPTNVSWESYGIQLQPSNADTYVQVDLGAGKTLVPTKSAVIGYPGGSHYTNQNYIKASNDGSNWTTLSTWSSHPGPTNTNGQGYLTANQNSVHVHSYVSRNIDNYSINISTSTGYRYFRLGGTNWSATSGGNGYMLVMNWLLFGYPS